MRERAKRIVGMTLIPVGLSLLVYNLLGYLIAGEGVKVVWEPETRMWISIGAATIAAGVLLYRDGK